MRLSGIVFVAEAFAGWLVGQLANSGRKSLVEWLLGDEQQRALQEAAAAAIHATARQLRPAPVGADDPEGPDHLARVIDQVFQAAPTPDASSAEHVTLLEELQAGVAARLAVLDDPEITGTHKSPAELLHISVQGLTDLLTGRLLRELLVRGSGGGPLAPLADQLNHDVTHLQGREHQADHVEHSASLARLIADVQSALATLGRLDQEARLIPAIKTAPPGRPVHDLTNPFELEVHRAIDAPRGTVALPALPAYVERDHDRQLQAIVKKAAGGRSVAVVLVGGSSTGKTRACWEAVQALPGDWRLWHPIDPTRPEAAVDALPAVRPRTVIWLNEAQHYLLPTADGIGERVAAGLRELLRDPERGPVLLLATMWLEYWAALTAPPAPDGNDPHTQARELLAGNDISVPEAFTGSSLDALKDAAQADPRLAEAAAHAEDGRIAQFLAGAPALLARYRNAPVAARTLIEVAMDARRLGHGLYLSHGLLEAATPGYLGDEQWDGLEDDWLAQALAYCAVPCLGIRGPLTRVRPRPGQPSPAQPRYRLADYLEQTGRETRRITLAPAALWDAFLDHAEGPDLLRIAEEAERRSLYHYAFRLYQRAGAAGDTSALRKAAHLLERTDDVMGLYARPAAHHGSPTRPFKQMQRTNRIDEVVSLYQRCAEAGEWGATQVGQLLQYTGRGDEAIEWYRRAAEAGDTFGSLWPATWLLEEAGRIDEIIDMYRRVIETGHSSDLERASELLERTGRTNQIIDTLLTRAAEAGDSSAVRLAAELLEQAGRVDEAITMYQRALEAGDTHYDLMRGPELLQRLGRIDEAISMCQRVAEAGDRSALRLAGELMADAGRVDEAIRMYQRAAEVGDRGALQEAATLLERAGRIDEAIDWYRRAAEAGDTSEPLVRVARLLEPSGRIDKIIDMYRRVIEAGHGFPVERASELLERTGRADEIIDALLTRAAEAGDSSAVRLAAELLEQAGRVDEAITMYERALQAGDTSISLQRAAELLEQAGRIGQVIGFCRRAVEAGRTFNLQLPVEVLGRTGRLEEVVALYERTAEGGDQSALARAAQLLEASGRIDEAITMYQRAAEPRSGAHWGLETNGRRSAAERAAWLLESNGRIDQAIDWARTRIAKVDDHDGLILAVELLRRAGRVDEAIGWLQAHAAEARDSRALRLAGQVLELSGRIDEAIEWYLQAAEANDNFALELADKLLKRANRTYEAARLRQYGLEPGGRIADEWI